MTKNLMILIVEVIEALFVLYTFVLTLGLFKINLDTGVALDAIHTIIVYSVPFTGTLVSGIYTQLMLYSEDEG